LERETGFEPATLALARESLWKGKEGEQKIQKDIGDDKNKKMKRIPGQGQTINSHQEW